MFKWFKKLGKKRIVRRDHPNGYYNYNIQTFGLSGWVEGYHSYATRDDALNSMERPRDTVVWEERY